MQWAASSGLPHGDEHIRMPSSLCGCDVSVYVPTTLLSVVNQVMPRLISHGCCYHWNVMKMEFNIESKVQFVLQLMIPFILHSSPSSRVLVFHSLMTDLGIWISAVIISMLSLVEGSRSVYFWHCYIMIFSLYYSCCCLPCCLWTRDWSNTPGLCGLHWNRVLSSGLQSCRDWYCCLFTLWGCWSYLPPM